MLHFYQKIIEIGAPGRVLEPFEVWTKNLKIFGIFQKSCRTECVNDRDKNIFSPKICPKMASFVLNPNFMIKWAKKTSIGVFWGL